MLTVIEELARRVDRCWAARGYDRDAFTDLAVEALERYVPPDFPTLARELSAGLALPRQRRLDQSFGQPAITLYNDERFVIEALCWHTGSPAIHEHSFDGAFRITTGRSVHSRYRFTEQDRLADTVAVGSLDLLGVEVLDHGSVTPIHRGDTLIHSAFHLDNPSMTVVVRTHDYDQPEYTYLPPRIAFDPASRGHALHKRLQLLDTLSGVGHPDYVECVNLALDSTDVYEGMQVLLRVGNHGSGPEPLERFADRYRARHGTRVTPVVAAVREQRRRAQLVALRSSVPGSDGRYFLACLLNAFDSDSFARQIATAYGTPTAISGAADGAGTADGAGGVDDAGTGATVAAGLRGLLGMRPEDEPLLSLAGRALFTGVGPDRFGTWWTETTGDDLYGTDADLLDRFYRQLVTHPLLAPVLAR